MAGDTIPEEEGRLVPCPVCLHEFHWPKAWWAVQASAADLAPSTGDDVVQSTWLALPPTHQLSLRLFDEPGLRTERRAFVLCPSTESVAVARHAINLRTESAEDEDPLAAGQSVDRYAYPFIPEWAGRLPGAMRPGETLTTGLNVDRSEPFHPIEPEYGDRPSFVIALVGSSLAGKTWFIKAMILLRRVFESQVLEEWKVTLTLEPIIGELWRAFNPPPEATPNSPSLRPQLESMGGTVGGTGWHVYFRLTIRGFDPRALTEPGRQLAAEALGRGEQPKITINLIFADTAGEDQSDDADPALQRRRTKTWGLSKGMICVTSAEELPSVQQARGRAGSAATGRGSEENILLRANQDLKDRPAAMSSSVGRTARSTAAERLREILRGKVEPTAEQLRIPLAYVLTKADLLHDVKLVDPGKGSSLPGYEGGRDSGDPDLRRLAEYLNQASVNSLVGARVCGAFTKRAADLQQTSAQVAGFIAASFEAAGILEGMGATARLHDALKPDYLFGPVSVHAVSAEFGRGVFEPLLAILLQYGLLGPLEDG